MIENNTIPPSPWIERFATLVRPAGAVLDIAAGGGRHSELFLARGHPVTALDRDTAALSRRLGAAENLEIISCDLEDGTPWPLKTRQFSAVVVCNYLFRPIMERLRQALAPGGVLIYDTFAVGQERLGRPRNPDYLLRQGELLECFGSGMQIIAYEQGECGAGTPAVRQRICAVNSSALQTLPDYSAAAERPPGAA